MTQQDYRATLNLPATEFAMKANLPQREPKMLARWEEQGLYKLIRQARAGRPKWVLHDGPPYANGRLHLGHAVNKILKDVIVKCASLNGYDSPYLPGWDCHGLPIEVNVEKKLGRPRTDDDSAKFRQACRTYAEEWVTIQSDEFKRMGIIGDWEKPYVTMDYKVEANIIRSLAKIYANGHIENGYKPVNWCLKCQSALAEAEVEYKEKHSPGISVGFPVPAEQEAEFFSRLGSDAGAGGVGEIMFVIWTTTPWTIPANRAVTLHPEFEYSLVQTETPANKSGKKMRLLVASKLCDELLEKWGLPNQGVLATVQGSKLDNLKLVHPYYEDREVLVTNGDYVSDEEGTGMVHSAPAYGLEDFFMGQEYNLELDNPVNDFGKYAENTPLVGGWHIFKDEDKLVELLEQSGRLIHNDDYQHQYPHCWRHKTPTIYRATRQWFVSMSKEDLIGKVLSETPKIRWTPDWGQNRIELMMKNRPDWCISRQRHWGVPIPFFVHKDSGDPHPRTVELLEVVAKIIDEEGVDGWHNLDIAELLGDDAKDYVKSQHILDVWFDSGTTHYSVLRQREELNYPANMYLEGSDQHRGWFQSSILCGVAMDEKAPYKEVLTHGFTVDSEGHKMSKSLGNVIEPAEVINRLGADVLRWWVISSDYTNEMVISQDILNSSGDVYRKIRNTMRFLLANLHDFDPTKDKVAPKDMLSLDQWLIAEALELQGELKQLYHDYQYPVACRKIHSFCVRELGGFYLDIIKDRQYTIYQDNSARRSAQSAIYITLEALARWLMPVLSFTAEEIWEHIPGKRSETIFTEEWSEDLFSLADVDSAFDKEEWQQILEVKDQVNHVIEEKRNANIIGAALESEVTLFCDDKLLSTLSKLGEELKFFLITSGACLRPIAEAEAVASDVSDTGVANLKVSVQPIQEAAGGVKCVRCWHRFSDKSAIGQDAKHPELCNRCVTNLSAPGETRQHG